VVIAVAALAVVALLAFARGRAHHRGDEPDKASSAVTLAGERG
jgi:hypothetical protein